MEDSTLLTVLEGIQNSQVRIAEVLERMHERMEANDKRIHERMEANDLTLAKMIADSQRMIADTQRTTADNNQASAKILPYVIDVTTRTECMTSEVLTRLASSREQSH